MFRSFFHVFNRSFFLLFVLFIGVAGCARKNPQLDVVERQGEQFREQSRSRSVEVVDAPYLGAKATPLNVTLTSPTLNRKVVLRRKGTLASIATAISELTTLPVQVAAESDTKKPSLASGASDRGHLPPGQQTPPATPPGQGQNQGGQGINLGLEALLQGKGGLSGLSTSASLGDGRILNVSYEGTLRGLLDHVSMLSGYGWDFNEKNSTITFAHLLVRTFTIMGAPGKVSYENKLTNKSKENTSTGTSSSLVGQPVVREDTSSQTAQVSSTNLTFDIWADTEKAVKALLSPEGVVVSNQSAGTLTVRDTPEAVRRVSTYVDDINARLSRQVALNVQVYALNITDNAEAGINLEAIFKDSNLTLAAGSLSDIGAINTATATVLTGQLKDSAGITKALGQWGKASQVTSAGGLVMSGQPVPVMAVQRHGYLAGIGKSTTDYSQTTEMTPGEVTTGFAMTVIPYILDQRRVVLQYNLNLSSLDEMKEITNSDVTIQLPQVSTQAFAQRSAMRLGQTLVLCGFEKETHNNKKTLGVISASSAADYGRTLLVITIKIESADV